MIRVVTNFEQPHHNNTLEQSILISEPETITIMTEEKVQGNKANFSHLVPGLCDDAAAYNLMCCTCFMVTVITPCVLFGLYSAEADGATKQTLFIVSVVLLTVGVLYTCFSIRKVIFGGVVMIPPAPPECMSLVKAKEGDKQHYKVAVKKLYVIVNPHGGLQRGPIILNTLCKPVWEAAGIEVVVKLTEYAGHAKHYARTLPLEGFDALCIIGGDGSFYELVNGLMTREDKKTIPIGLIPGGSGNSVMCDLGSWSARVAAERVVEGSVCFVDVNHVTDEEQLSVYSVNEVSWGLVGDVGIVAEPWRWLGPERYNICAMWGVMKRKFKGCRLVTKDSDGNVITDMSGAILTAFVNNTQHFGKGLRGAPMAKMDDGLMDFVFAPPIGASTPSRGDLVQILQQLPFGSHHQNPNVFHAQVHQCSITPVASEGIINIDGENERYNGTITIKCIHKAISMYIPLTYTPMTTRQKQTGQGGVT